MNKLISNPNLFIYFYKKFNKLANKFLSLGEARAGEDFNKEV